MHNPTFTPETTGTSSPKIDATGAVVATTPGAGGSNLEPVVTGRQTKTYFMEIFGFTEKQV